MNHEIFESNMIFIQEIINRFPDEKKRLWFNNRGTAVFIMEVN